MEATDIGRTGPCRFWAMACDCALLMLSLGALWEYVWYIWLGRSIRESLLEYTLTSLPRLVWEKGTDGG